jgi:hypothetical protein
VPASPVPPSPSHPRSRDARRRESSILGRLVIGAAALAVATGLVIENLGPDIPAKIYFAVLLGIVALGLIIGSWMGRARWLIFVGLGLVICLWSVVAVPQGPSGEVTWIPTSMRDIDDSEPYRATAGEAVLDLTAVDFGERDRAIDVRLGFGQLTVIVPHEVDVEVDARVQGGEMTIFGRHDEGWDIGQTYSESGSENEGPVRLDLRVTFGQIDVRRGSASDNPLRLDSDNDNRFDFDFRPRIRERIGER